MQRVLYANGKERVSSITFLIVINITVGLSVVERKGPAYGDKNSNGSQPAGFDSRSSVGKPVSIHLIQYQSHHPHLS